jgi:hypothetical protein
LDAGAGALLDEKYHFYAVRLGSIGAGFGANGSLIVAFALEVIPNYAFGSLTLSFCKDSAFDEAYFVFEVTHFAFGEAPEGVFSDTGALCNPNYKPNFFFGEAVGKDLYF